MNVIRTVCTTPDHAEATADSNGLAPREDAAGRRVVDLDATGRDDDECDEGFLVEAAAGDAAFDRVDFERVVFDAAGPDVRRTPDPDEREEDEEDDRGRPDDEAAVVRPRDDDVA